MLLSWIFIPFYTTIYFFRKEICFFKCLYFSEYDIRMRVSSFKINIYSGCFLLEPRSWNNGKVKHETFIRNWTDNLTHELSNDLRLENEEI